MPSPALRSRAVLLIIDMINDLEFPGNEELVGMSETLGKDVAKLKAKCRRAGIPAIYVNDNVGLWRSDFQGLIRRCMASKSAGRNMVRQIRPDSRDLLILKPAHSAFYGTPLVPLLTDMQVTSILLAGVLTHFCILLTAADGYMRNFQLYVPEDCVAGRSTDEHHAALQVMKSSFRIDITPSRNLDLSKIKRNSRVAAQTKTR